MKTLYVVTTIAAAILVGSIPMSATAQKTSMANKALLSPAEKAFVQDAINRNNEAMALAQSALQQSQKKEIQIIARQFLSDHRAAQKKLYAMANLSDTLPYSQSVAQPVAGSSKLPLTDNLGSRRNNTVASITGDNNGPSGNTTTNSAGSNMGNTVAGNTGTQRSSQTGADTASRFGVNQTFNGNTSIDNANGVNNGNRTDIASYSGRYSENNTIANTQNPVITNTTQSANSSGNTVNGNTIAGTVTTNGTSSTAPSGTANNTTGLANTPNFPNRVIDTIRQTGSTLGFQSTGTNLSFPGNERYTKTTPATTPNSNAGSDYGVNGVVVNNAQTNALNTAPYSSNDINSNIVQTGRVLPTSDPAVVINSSTASMQNKDVGFNNANANYNGAVQQNGQLAADNANGLNRRTSEVVNSNNPTSVNRSNQNTITTTTTTNTNNGAVLAGRTRGNKNSSNMNAQNATSTQGQAATTAFYSQPYAATEALNTLRTTSADGFDMQWATLINNNQQAAVTAYQAALRRTTNAQLKTYINTVLPILRGHQFALKQWQEKQY